MTRTEFFDELLRDTTGQLELRRMKWNARKNGKGGYDMLERLFSRDVTELEAESPAYVKEEVRGLVRHLAKLAAWRRKLDSYQRTAGTQAAGTHESNEQT